MRLHVEVALQEETHNLMVTKAGAEVERNVIFIVLGVYWREEQISYTLTQVNLY